MESSHKLYYLWRLPDKAGVATNRQQAIAIGLSKARKKSVKIPSKKMK